MFDLSFSVTVAMFLTILLLLATSTVVILLGLNQNQIAIAQQQQQQQELQGFKNNQTSLSSSSFLTKQQQEPTLEGISFDIDNLTFYHHMASVNGIQLHYVIGGQGEPIVLIHGWPQTWYEWRHVMPALAENYTVIVPDLRGLGDNRTEISFSVNGTMRGNINVTNTGTFLSISRGNNVTYAQGQGVIMTRDGSDEKANHTF